MSKGSVYFVNTQKLDRIYARVTVSRSAITSVSYMQASKIFLSTCEELNLTVWYLDASKESRREKRLNILYQVKMYRPAYHVRYLPRLDATGNLLKETSEGDRFILSYESGEWDMFEVEDAAHPSGRKINLVETDKTKEHEKALTAIDHHINLNLIVTSCEGG